MAIKDGFVLREVAGQAMVVATGEASRGFHGMIKLNETGALIWRGISAGEDEGAIAQRLAERYDVSPEAAARDVAAFVEKMAAEGFLA